MVKRLIRRYSDELKEVHGDLGTPEKAELLLSSPSEAAYGKMPSYYEEYRAAWDEPWVQDGRMVCVVIAGSAGAAIVVWVALPYAIAANESALLSAAASPYAAEVLLATEAAALYLTQHPELAQDGMEAIVVVSQACYDNPDDPVGGVKQAGQGLVIIYGPGTLSNAQVVRGQKGAQNINFKEAKLKMCVNNASVSEVEGSVVAPTGVRANKAAGGAWELELLNNQLPITQSQIQPQITIKSGGPSTKKVRLDTVGIDSSSGVIKLTDGKASASAGLTPNQIIVYPAGPARTLGSQGWLG